MYVSNQNPIDHVAIVRSFNRFYTRQMGVLHKGVLDSPFNLTEVRVLYELAHREDSTAKELAADLGIDSGYLSRILQRFEQQRLLTQKPSTDDKRHRLLSLTELGQRTFAPLNIRASLEIQQLLVDLSTEEKDRLIQAMRTIEALLKAHRNLQVPYLLRPHHSGDMGWVVQGNAVLYAQEFGWNEQYEALVARIVARFLENFDPQRERCWIAEREGEQVGCVFLIKKSKTVAQLRLLLVEPRARGLGIGKRLVHECELFARQTGYRKIMLWTNSILNAARHIYEQAGYRLMSEEPHHSFGQDLVGQVWEKGL